MKFCQIHVTINHCPKEEFSIHALLEKQKELIKKEVD